MVDLTNHLPAPTSINARVELHVTITDPQAAWDRALDQCVEDGIIGSRDDIDEGVTGMIGTRDAPDLGGCLRMIFDIGSQPGIQIEDSSAEVDG